MRPISSKLFFARSAQAALGGFAKQGTESTGSSTGEHRALRVRAQFQDGYDSSDQQFADAPRQMALPALLTPFALVGARRVDENDIPPHLRGAFQDAFREVEQAKRQPMLACIFAATERPSRWGRGYTAKYELKEVVQELNRYTPAQLEEFCGTLRTRDGRPLMFGSVGGLARLAREHFHPAKPPLPRYLQQPPAWYGWMRQCGFNVFNVLRQSGDDARWCLVAEELRDVPADEAAEITHLLGKLVYGWSSYPVHPDKMVRYLAARPQHERAGLVEAVRLLDKPSFLGEPHAEYLLSLLHSFPDFDWPGIAADYHAGCPKGLGSWAHSAIGACLQDHADVLRDPQARRHLFQCMDRWDRAYRRHYPDISPQGPGGAVKLLGLLPRNHWDDALTFFETAKVWDDIYYFRGPAEERLEMSKVKHLAGLHTDEVLRGIPGGQRLAFVQEISAVADMCPGRELMEKIRVFSPATRRHMNDLARSLRNDVRPPERHEILGFFLGAESGWDEAAAQLRSKYTFSGY